MVMTLHIEHGRQPGKCHADGQSVSIIHSSKTAMRVREPCRGVKSESERRRFLGGDAGARDVERGGSEITPDKWRVGAAMVRPRIPVVMARRRQCGECGRRFENREKDAVTQTRLWIMEIWENVGTKAFGGTELDVQKLMPHRAVSKIRTLLYSSLLSSSKLWWNVR